MKSSFTYVCGLLEKLVWVKTYNKTRSRGKVRLERIHQLRNVSSILFFSSDGVLSLFDHAPVSGAKAAPAIFALTWGHDAAVAAAAAPILCVSVAQISTSNWWSESHRELPASLIVSEMSVCKWLSDNRKTHLQLFKPFGRISCHHWEF